MNLAFVGLHSLAGTHQPETRVALSSHWQIQLIIGTVLNSWRGTRICIVPAIMVM